jgi:hypothetical protein
VSFQLAGERDFYSERRLDFLSGCLFSLLGGVGFLRGGYKEKKVSIIFACMEVRDFLRQRVGES